MTNLREYHQIIYLEPYLVHAEGHFLESTKCFSLAFRKFTDCQIFVGEKLDSVIAMENDLIRFFSPCIEPALIRFLSNTRGLWRLCRFFRNYILTNQRKRLRNDLEKLPVFSGKTLFFFPSASLVDALETIKYVNTHYSDCDMAFVLHVDYGEKQVSIFKKTLSAIRRKTQEKNNTFGLYSDSNLIISEYEKQGIYDIHLLPIPHIPVDAINTMPVVAKTTITLSYLGGARQEKGFQFLPSLIRAFREKQYDRQLRWRIQISGIKILSSKYEKRIMSNTLAQLKQQETDQIEFIETLESHIYYKLLSETDIILLPYINIIPKRYYATSGILAEAMALGKVAVVPADTWLAQQIENSGGGVIFNTPEELPEKVEEAIRNYRELQKKALQYSKSWIKANNSDAYLISLMNHINQQCYRHQT